MKIAQMLRGKQTLKELQWYDILILTVIMFGQAIWQSNMMWLSLGNRALAGSVEFSAADNIQAIISQTTLLLIAMGYLRLRSFDFSQWKAKITLKATLFGILLFVVAALVLDIYFMTVGNMFIAPQPAAASVNPMLAQINYTTILFAMLNGFYEEIYFLGMCLYVPPKRIKAMFLISLLIRISFHTYQGMVSALGLGLLGVVYYIAYEKSDRKNLYPFFLSHAIADVIGLGILAYFF